MSLTFSKYNIFSQIRDSENYFILNLLSGNADILTPELAGRIIENKFENADEFIQKGYIVDEENEQKIYKEKYVQFIQDRDQDELQLFFVPNYTCNFACKYCYQDEYTTDKSILTYEIIDSFFNYITKEFDSRKKYITIFGGEPLLNSDHQKKMLSYFIEQCNRHHLEIAVVTNGYTLTDYLDILKNANIREVQVTLDGLANVHNARRFLKNGEATFDQIVKGIDALIENQIPVNLRMVIDKENINELPGLADFAIDKGWTKSEYFKTQIGRNYELHHCQENNNRLFSRISLYDKIYNLIQEHPHIIEFHKPAFSVSRFLSENGELPEALFDSCPGAKNEWAFDFSGKIFSCTATVGKNDEQLGTFHPTITKNETVIRQWQLRNVTTIKECKDCSVQLACGGGCAAVAKNKTNILNSPDCRPVKELLEMGINLYFEN